MFFGFFLRTLSLVSFVFFCLLPVPVQAQVPCPPSNLRLSSSGSAPSPSPCVIVTIPGWTSVTQAVNATGSGTRYDIGGGNNFGTELSAVPWQSLKPGDAVNIYYRATPYRHKILLSEQGTAANPIVINGVTDSSGNRPTIDAANAVTVNPGEWHTAYQGTLIMINKRSATGSYGQNAKHYRIQNLRLTGVRPSNSYTHNGVTSNYADWNRAIWSAGGQYFVLEGMIIENNGSGVFLQANDDPGSLSKTWTIRGSKFENNGNGNRDHQIYFQSVSDPGEYNIIEGCYFGPPTPGQSIAQLKFRGTAGIVRYNWFNSAARTLDIVEAQDAIPDWMYTHYTAQQLLDYYRSTYVYGNVFVNDHSATGGTPSYRPLHFGADSFDDDALFSTAGAANGQPGMRGYGAPTYFFHNTVYFRGNSNQIWRGDLFDAENNNSPGPTPTPGAVEAWNNVFEFAGNTRIGVMNRSGTTRFEGANLLYTNTLSVFAESDAYANTGNLGDDPNVTVQYNGTTITGSAAFLDATNTNLEMKNFNLGSGSPAAGKAHALPAALSAFSVDSQPVSPADGGGAVRRTRTQNLGAFE